MKAAILYKKINGNRIQCQLCPHRCTLIDGQLGVCRVRKNIDGELYSLNYDRVAATHLDPIEKKPLYHFLPGSSSFSLATMGCNFSCKFCQNHSLSVVVEESAIHGDPITPEQLVATARKHRAASISYTYSEPTIYFELMLETARLAREAGMKNVIITNGYMTPEALEMIAPYLDAANVDIKAFSEDFYLKYCGGRLMPVLETVKAMKKKGVWVEITTLLIPGVNTDKKEINDLASFIAGVDTGMPWHISRFFPQHRLLDIPITPTEAIYRALETGKRLGIKYLYGGNITSDEWSDTDCPGCGALLIERSGYQVSLVHLQQGKCDQCGLPLPGVWE